MYLVDNIVYLVYGCEIGVSQQPHILKQNLFNSYTSLPANFILASVLYSSQSKDRESLSKDAVNRVLEHFKMFEKDITPPSRVEEVFPCFLEYVLRNMGVFDLVLSNRRKAC